MAQQKFKTGTLTVEQTLRIERSARREADIEFGLNFNRHRVHKNKKAYNRKDKHRGRDF